MRVQVIIGHTDEGEIEAIRCGIDIVEQGKFLAKLTDNGGVVSQRKRYREIEVVTNDHVVTKRTFRIRDEKITEAEEAAHKANKAAQAAIATAGATKSAADHKAAADAVAELDRQNLAIRENIRVAGLSPAEREAEAKAKAGETGAVSFANSPEV